MPPFEEESLNIPFDQFNNLEVFFNLGYNVKENFTSKFSEDVIKIDGIKMLITQAVASFNIWADSEIKLEDVYHNITERLKNEN
jgi:shikimate 5-dehydrogenase